MEAMNDSSAVRAGALSSLHASSLQLLRRGASGAFVVSVCGTGVSFLANLVMARVIGRQEFGVYALMFSWVSVLAVVAQAGQDISMIRLLPFYIREGAWGEVRGLRRGVGAIVLALSGCIALGGCAVVHVIGAGQSADWRHTFYIGFAMLPVLTQLQQSGALHRAFKRPVVSGLYQTLGRPLLLIVLLGALALMLQKVDAPWAAAASLAAAALALAGSAWHLWRTWPEQGREVAPRYEIRRWLIVGSQMSMLSIIVVSGNRLDVLILGALMGTGDVGPYYAAVRMAGFALFAQGAANVVLAPMIAERYDARDLGGLQLVATRAARFAFAGAFAVSLGFSVTGHWLLALFGLGFDAAYVPLLVLLWGYCATTALGEVGFMLSMTKFQRLASVLVLVGVAANAVVAWLLVPTLGATGAAIGAVVSLLVWRGLAWWTVRSRLGIDPSIFGAHGKVVPR
jgi:O-antigen/teichoic acid export membrane protein